MRKPHRLQISILLLHELLLLRTPAWWCWFSGVSVVFWQPKQKQSRWGRCVGLRGVCAACWNRRTERLHVSVFDERGCSPDTQNGARSDVRCFSSALEASPPDTAFFRPSFSWGGHGNLLCTFIYPVDVVGDTTQSWIVEYFPLIWRTLGVCSFALIP